MTELSEARAQAEAALEMMERIGSQGWCLCVTNGAAEMVEAGLRALLAASAPVEGDEREALGQAVDERLREAADRMSPLSKKPYTSLDLALVRDAAYQVAAGFRRPSTPTEEEWRAAMDAERARQIEHGYDDAHDQEHGARHLLNWAIDYARRGKALAAATMIRSVLRLPTVPTEGDVERAASAMYFEDCGMQPTDEVRGSDEFDAQFRSYARAALSAVHPEVAQ